MHINVKFFGKVIEGIWYPADVYFHEVKVSVTCRLLPDTKRTVFTNELFLRHLIDEAEKINQTHLLHTFPFVADIGGRTYVIRDIPQLTIWIQEMRDVISQIDTYRSWQLSKWQD